MLKVDCIKSGPGVIIEKFDGESNGMTSIKDINWKVGEDITFIVSGKYDAVSMSLYNI